MAAIPHFEIAQRDHAMNNPMSRRHFSQWLGKGVLACGATSVLGLSSLRALAWGAISDAPGNLEHDTLVQYAYVLLPLLEPAHARYRAVADKVSLLAGQVPDIGALVKGGIDALNSSGKDAWLNLPPEESVAIVSDQAGTPFFGFMHFNTAEIVMRDPALWATLGYQGSAIEHGGYLYRGFDDINWLPAAESGALK